MPTKKQPSAKEDAGAGQVQSRMDHYTEQGFRGVKVDPTPNDNYTVAGVTSGAPTPETDEDAEAEARTALSPGPIAAARLEAEAAAEAGEAELKNSVTETPKDDD